MNRWAQIEAAAKGQTVYFNAWAGSEHINDYVQWAAAGLEKGYGVKLLKGQLYDGEASRRMAPS